MKRPSRSSSQSLGPELARSGRSAAVAVPLVADDELLGLLTAKGTSEVELARAAANQTAVALKKIELIERLTEKNLIKDFFEQLAGGSVPGDLEGRAARLGCDLDQRYVVLAAGPADDALEKAVAAAAARGSLFDRRDDSIRGLLRIPMSGEEPLLEKLREVHAALDTPVSVGISHVCQGAASFRAGFEEAQHALLGASVIRGKPAVMTYEELGPYKYLLRMPIDSAMRTSTETRSPASPNTTGSARPHSCARSRSSSAAAGTSARQPRPSTSIRTRFVSGYGAFRSFRGSTYARTIGSSSRSP